MSSLPTLTRGNIDLGLKCFSSIIPPVIAGMPWRPFDRFFNYFEITLRNVGPAMVKLLSHISTPFLAAPNSDSGISSPQKLLLLLLTFI